MKSRDASRPTPLWNHPILRAAVLVGLTVLVYVPSVSRDFVWNDDTFLYENPLILADDGLYLFWFTAQAPDYFPVVSTTLWFEWRWWGMDARGYRIVNILLHAVAAVLWWRVLRRLAVPGAWLAGLIFAIHPVNVESVAWITERKNTLPMVFYALTLLGYLRFEATRAPRWYGLALFAFALSLLGKTSGVMLPFALLGCAWWQRRRIAGADLLRTAPFFILAAVLGLVTAWFQRYSAIGDDVIRTDGFASRLAIAGWASWFYLYKALVPLNLCFVYPRWSVDPTRLLPYLPGVAWVAVFGLLVRYRRSWGRAPLVALGYFVITLLPVLGFLNIYFMRYSLVADHWQYTSVIGVIALAVGLVTHAVRGWRPARQRAAMFATAALVVTLSVLTWRQAAAYAGAESLYRDTLDKNPGAWLAHNNLGQVLHEQGRDAEAMTHLRRAIELAPDYALAHFNVGVILAVQGQVEAAVRAYDVAVQLDPRYPLAHLNRGVLLAQLGRREEAHQAFETAVRLAPRLPDAHFNLAQSLSWQGRTADAAEHYQKVVDLNPRSAAAHYHLGVILAQQKQPEKAEPHFLAAVDLQPTWGEAQGNLGRALADQGRLPEAIACYQEAIRLYPQFSKAYRNLGEALGKLGRLDEAAAAYTQAAAIEPQHVEGHGRLAEVLARLGRRDAAAAECRRMLELDPANAWARAALQTLSPASAPAGPDGR